MPARRRSGPGPPPGGLPTKSKAVGVEFVLKTCVWDRDEDVLVVVCDPGEQIELTDPDGKVEILLDILQTGPCTPATVRTALAERGIEAGVEEIDDALAALDGLR